MCNFFGKKLDKKEEIFFYELKKKYKAWLIQDATHCIDINGVESKYSDFICLSPYKFYSLPFGAIYLTSIKFLEENSITFLSDEKLTLKFLNEILSKINFYKKNNLKLLISWIIKSLISFFYIKINIKLFDDDYYINNINLIPHPKTNYIIKNYISYKFKKIDLIKFRIKKNFLKWKGFILNLSFKNQEKIKIDEIDINSDVTPYFLKISSDKKTIMEYYNFLKNKKIPIQTWPNLSRLVKQNYFKFNALNLRNSYIYIPSSYQNFPLNIKIKKVLDNINFKDHNFDYELIEIIDPNSWYQYFSKTGKNNLLQDWRYGDILSQTKNINVKRYLLRNKINLNEKCIFQILKNKNNYFNISYINRGPIFFDDISEGEKLNILNFLLYLFDQKLKLKFLKINPEIQLNSNNVFLKHHKKLIFFQEPHWNSSLINLNDDLIDIKNNFKGSIKNDINFFEKQINDLSVNVYESLNNPIPIQNKKILEIMYLQDQKKKNFQGISSTLLNKILNNTEYRLYEIIHKKTKKVIAYGLFYLHFPGATYLLGTYSHEFKHYRAMTSILYMSIKELKKLNFSFLDLGGIDNIENKNVAYFKKKFNGKEYTLVGKKNFL